MNLLGKSFVVLILIMSLGFMFLSMAVYATHKNWKDEHDQLQTALNEKQSENQRLTEERNRLESRLQTEKTFADSRIGQLEGERVQLVEQQGSIQQKLDLAREDHRKAVAAAQAAQENNAKTVEELIGLRAEIRKEQADRDKFFTIAKDATDTLQQRLGELVRAEELKQQLTEQVARFTQRLRSLGHDPSVFVDVVPRVDGEVLLVRRANADQLIEISIGSDDGLQRGHTVEVFRGRQYLGRAQIVDTDPDRAVGRILPRTLIGRIEVGDRVATKLRVDG